VASLQAARARADAARDARDHMLAIVAHDLSNPLNLIRLATAALLRTPIDAAALGKRLGTIDRAVDRMGRLIRDLVDATHIEHDQLSISVRDEPIGGILREVADAFGPAAGEKGVALEVVAPATDVSVLADRSRLTQVFGNLVGNALKFTPAGGGVVLRAQEDGDAVRFDVEDTGSGIEAENLPHVFERYWKGREGGTGLGLFIARSIVSAHGGRLVVRSELGAGSTFSFAIPRIASRPLAASVPRESNG
jgi:signal transduction histidine kinase